MAWYDIFTFPWDIAKEAAFAKVFDGIIQARNAVRAGFQGNEAAKAQLAEFYDAFTRLPPGTERSNYRRDYQDMMGATADAGRQLTTLSKDLGTLQAAATSAHQGRIPYELVDGEVAVRNLVLHGVTEDDIAAAGQAGVGALATGTMILIAVLSAIISAALAYAARAIGVQKVITAGKVEIAKSQIAAGQVPQLPLAEPSLATELGAVGRVGLVTMIIGGMGLYWLLRKPSARLY